MPDAAPSLRIVVVDDHAFIREGLKALIDAQPDMEVVGEAESGEAALRQAQDCTPDILVMDLSMPRMNGMKATVEVKRSCPRVKVLALSMHEDTTYLRSLLEAGASGYVLKRSAPQDLIRALRHVAAGDTYLDPALAGKVVGGFVHRSAWQGEAKVYDLSEREGEVLRRIAQGYSNKEVAAQFGLSVKTVETYKARAMEKLDLSSRADLVRYAAQQGWLQDV